jgi:RNA polymerase sigma factor (sigma-70 family)
VAATSIHETVETIWRIESVRLIASLTRLLRDVGLAEEAAQDALVAALEEWPAAGVPERPGAWLLTVARRRALDRLRHERQAAPKHAEIARSLQGVRETAGVLDEALLDDVGDDVLRLMFIACHPVLSPEARTALTLRILGGLTTAEIARATLVPEATVAQRIVRAKKTLAEAHVPFELPATAERAERLGSLLEVLYLVFNEGYAATAGDDWLRPALCEEALRLARMLAALAPGEPEAHGLLALMELQASRLRARVNRSGEPILLLDQDRSRWDRLLIGRGLASLARAEALAAGSPGPYALQAAIAACHARARSGEETDWPRIAAIYQALSQAAPSPVVELNRAVAVGRAFGPEAGLRIVATLADEPALASYHLLPAVRGDLLFRAGRPLQAAEEFERAAALTRNAREREVLRARAAGCRTAAAASSDPASPAPGTRSEG